VFIFSCIETRACSSCQNPQKDRIMIVTDLAHLERQIAMTPSFRKALQFLRQPGLAELPDGTVTLDGKRVFAIVQRYETIATHAPRFEYHRDYIDVQYVVTGEEVIGWAPAAVMAVTEPYDAEKDIAFGTVDRDRWTAVRLGAGQAAVLYPEDGHAPRLSAGTVGPVVKVVVKIACGERP
jgi:YhcH/YjgK/YiaL family protein